jgi:hypothetical protein
MVSIEKSANVGKGYNIKKLNTRVNEYIRFLLEEVGYWR